MTEILSIELDDETVRHLAVLGVPVERVVRIETRNFMTKPIGRRSVDPGSSHVDRREGACRATTPRDTRVAAPLAPNAVWNGMDSTDATTFPALLSHDHVRLDAMLDAILEVVHGAEQPMLDARWAVYEEQLLTHLEAEETYLLPELAKHDAALAERARHDHDTLRRALAAIGIGLDLHVVRDDQMSELARRLRAHAEMEEGALSGWADSAASPSLLDSLYRRLREAWDRIGTASIRPLRAHDSLLRKGCTIAGGPEPERDDVA